MTTDPLITSAFLYYVPVSDSPAYQSRHAPNLADSNYDDDQDQSIMDDDDEDFELLSDDLDDEYIQPKLLSLTPSETENTIQIDIPEGANVGDDVHICVIRYKDPDGSASWVVGMANTDYSQVDSFKETLDESEDLSDLDIDNDSIYISSEVHSLILRK